MSEEIVEDMLEEVAPQVAGDYPEIAQRYKAGEELTDEELQKGINERTRLVAVAQASADIMLGMIIGKTKDEALRLGNLFLRMIKGEASDEEIDELEEAGALKDISHMPARVKCAVLGWHTLEEAFKQEK